MAVLEDAIESVAQTLHANLLTVLSGASEDILTSARDASNRSLRALAAGDTASAQEVVDIHFKLILEQNRIRLTSGSWATARSVLGVAIDVVSGLIDKGALALAGAIDDLADPLTDFEEPMHE